MQTALDGLHVQHSIVFFCVYPTWICIKMLGKSNTNYPKWWFNDDLPWYNPSKITPKNKSKPTVSFATASLFKASKIAHQKKTSINQNLVFQLWNPRHPGPHGEDRYLNPQTSPEKAFRGTKHLLTRYLEDFGCLGEVGRTKTLPQTNPEEISLLLLTID